MKKKSYLFLLLALLALCASATAEDQAMFEYQGRVKVGGTPFTGTGRFKFAILNTSQTTTLWSNDETSIDGSQPSTYLDVQVTEGVFTVMIGDTSLGMRPINSSIFSSQTPLRLRVWFSDIVYPFEQLYPDGKLVNISLVTVSTGTTDFTIYVNGATGNDANNGLTTATAKKTVQGGVDAVPRQLRCNVTVSIAPGVYRETVDVSGVSGAGIVWGNEVVGNHLIIQGDPSWTPASGGSPNVCITGCDEDATSTPIRKFGLICHNNTSVELRGLLASFTSHDGFLLETGTYLMLNCKAANCSYAGVALWIGAFLRAHDSVAAANVHGFGVGFSKLWVVGCTAEYNTHSGIYVDAQSQVQIDSGTFRNNQFGIHERDHGSVGLGSPVLIQNNTTGIAAYYHSYASGTAGVTFSGNGTNTVVQYGSNMY